MNHVHKALAMMAIMSAAFLSGCSSDAPPGEHQDAAGPAASQGETDGGEHGGEAYREHDREGGEHGGEAGEESGAELAIHETYDAVRNGVRLILAYDAESNSFIGTVEKPLTGGPPIPKSEAANMVTVKDAVSTIEKAAMNTNRDPKKVVSARIRNRSLRLIGPHTGPCELTARDPRIGDP